MERANKLNLLKLPDTLSTTTGCGCPEPWPQPMGIVQMTVKWKAVRFCKFSVTFWVDNEIGGANSSAHRKYFRKESISPLETTRAGAGESCSDIFLTGKISRVREFSEGKS